MHSCETLRAFDVEVAALFSEGMPMSSSAPPSTAATPGVPPGAAPPARRAGRPGWRDPRIVVGVLIVALSVLAGAVLLGSGDETVAVWAVRKDLPSGSRVTASALVRRDVRFADPGALARYVTGPPPVGRTLSRAVGADELLPRAALGGRTRHLVEVPLRVDVQDVPATVREGSTVDVWVAPREEATADRARADLVLPGVTVVRLPQTSPGLAPEATRQVIVAVAPGTPLQDAIGRIGVGRVVLTRRS